MATSEFVASSEDCNTDKCSVLEMCQYVADSSATVKSQQRGDPELTMDQKVAVLKDLFSRRPAAFLTTFGRYLLPAHLVCFESLRNDYEVDFQVKELQILLNREKNRVKIRNRRFQYIQQEIEHGQYFSDHEMRRRNPLLYEQYIGQYLTEQERKELNLDGSSETGLAGQMLDQIDKLRTAELLARQEDLEEEQIEEVEDEEDEDEDDDESNNTMQKRVCPEVNVHDEHTTPSGRLRANNTRKEISISEKRLLREEFVSIMHHLFLSGSDKDFNYQQVDTCSEYDSLKMRERDEEEAYFDDEEPETWITEDV